MYSDIVEIIINDFYLVLKERGEGSLKLLGYLSFVCTLFICVYVLVLESMLGESPSDGGNEYR